MRKIGLDILRGLAVILVLFRHSNLDNNILQHFGWLGVDLFFVLSGFLISNLLFNEYKKNKELRIKRFLIRRAFKIFSPFYFFMFITLLFNLLVKGDSDIEYHKLLSELFYLQSYFPRIWLHTWTLAVEEHFYLIFSITLFFVTKKQLFTKRNIISSLVIFLILSFAMRFYISYPLRNEEFIGFVQTHLRVDGILMGVLISYILNFTNIDSWYKGRKWIPICLSILLVAPGFYFEAGSFFMNTVGLTIVNIGFSIIVLLALDIDEYVKNGLHSFFKIGLKMFSFIGVNSYSIYLWHLNSKNIGSYLFSFDSYLSTLIYILISIILGTVMSYLIEKPSIIIRDYLFNKNDFFNNIDNLLHKKEA